MTQVFIRLVIYVVTGALFGIAGWFVLFSKIEVAALQSGFVVMLSAMGLAIAVFGLRYISITSADGIRINALWNVAAMDCVCIIAATITSLFMIDGYEVIYNTPALIMNDPVALGVVSIMYLPSALILAGFVTSTGSQVITVNAEGLMISGAFGKNSAGWSDIEGLSPHEQYVVVSRVGVPIPRRLRTNIEIAVSNGDILTLYQPGLKSTSRRILKKLSANAPHRLHGDLDQMRSAWL